MTLRIPGNKTHSDENNISSGWQKANISGVSQESSAQLQCVASLDPWCRLVYHPDIQ